MFVPIFLWGGLVGWCYGWLRRKSAHPIWGICIGSGLVLLCALLLESSNIKMLGGILVAFIGLSIMVKLFDRGIWYWLISAEKRSPTLLTGRSVNARERAKLHARNAV